MLRNSFEIEHAKKLVEKEVEEIKFIKFEDGVTIRADTLGGLEAFIRILEGKQIPIRKAEVGSLSRQDIMESQNIQDDLRRVILVFNQKIPAQIHGKRRFTNSTPSDVANADHWNWQLFCF